MNIVFKRFQTITTCSVQIVPRALNQKDGWIQLNSYHYLNKFNCMPNKYYEIITKKGKMKFTDDVTDKCNKSKILSKFFNKVQGDRLAQVHPSLINTEVKLIENQNENQSKRNEENFNYKKENCLESTSSQTKPPERIFNENVNIPNLSHQSSENSDFKKEDNKLGSTVTFLEKDGADNKNEIIFLDCNSNVLCPNYEELCLKSSVCDKKDHCNKKSNCNKKDPCQKSDPCNKKDDCNKLDPCSKKDPCQKSDPCSKKDPCIKSDPCSKKKPCKKSDPCSKKDPCQKSDPCSKKDPCGKSDPCSKKNPCTKSDTCIKKDPCHKSDPCSKKDPCQKSDPCSKKNNCNKQDPCSKTNPCQKSDPCVKKDPCKKSNPCSKKDPCQKSSSCSSKKNPCQKSDPCSKDDHCTAKDPCRYKTEEVCSKLNCVKKDVKSECTQVKSHKILHSDKTVEHTRTQTKNPKKSTSNMRPHLENNSSRVQNNKNLNENQFHCNSDVHKLCEDNTTIVKYPKLLSRQDYVKDFLPNQYRVECIFKEHKSTNVVSSVDLKQGPRSTKEEPLDKNSISCTSTTICNNAKSREKVLRKTWQPIRIEVKKQSCVHQKEKRKVKSTLDWSTFIDNFKKWISTPVNPNKKKSKKDENIRKFSNVTFNEEIFLKPQSCDMAINVSELLLFKNNYANENLIKIVENPSKFSRSDLNYDGKSFLSTFATHDVPKCALSSKFTEHFAIIEDENVQVKLQGKQESFINKYLHSSSNKNQQLDHEFLLNERLKLATTKALNENIKHSFTEKRKNREFFFNSDHSFIVDYSVPSGFMNVVSKEKNEQFFPDQKSNEQFLKKHKQMSLVSSILDLFKRNSDREKTELIKQKQEEIIPKNKPVTTDDQLKKTKNNEKEMFFNTVENQKLEFKHFITEQIINIPSTEVSMNIKDGYKKIYYSSNKKLLEANKNRIKRQENSVAMQPNTTQKKDNRNVKTEIPSITSQVKKSASFTKTLHKLEKNLLKSDPELNTNFKNKKPIKKRIDYQHLTNFDQIVSEFNKYSSSKKLVCKHCQQRPKGKQKRQNTPQIASYKDLLNINNLKRIEEEKERKQAVEDARTKMQKHFKS